ncbi:MAG: hypothetical protein SOX25_02230 [Eubacteriales bacterium]|nr:hypothetical protein [Eubacteriales bacterium]
MFAELEGKEQTLFELLTAIPPDWAAMEQFLREGKLTSQEITKAATYYVDECFCEARDAEIEAGISRSAGIVPDLHSTYLCDAVKLLLPFGLDPNGIFNDGDSNIMDSLRYVDNEFLAADALALLLEHGGDPTLYIPGANEPLFCYVSDDVFSEADEMDDRKQYASLVHFWMVLIGYGARYNTNSAKMMFFKEYHSSRLFDPDKLRNHRNYYFGISHLEGRTTVHIYDKETLWEVARLT